MKIQARNAAAYLRQVETLAAIAGIDSYEGEKLFAKLVRFEARAHRLCELECNTGQDQDKKLKAIEKKINKLFNDDLPGFFINGDPRGYALKIKSEQATTLKEKGMPLHTDWGGYGILAPEF